MHYRLVSLLFFSFFMLGLMPHASAQDAEVLSQAEPSQNNQIYLPLINSATAQSSDTRTW